MIGRPFVRDVKPPPFATLGDHLRAKAAKPRKAKKAKPLVPLASWRAQAGGIVMELPIELIGESNAREHPGIRSTRAAAQREMVTHGCRSFLPSPLALMAHGPIDVVMTRLAPARSQFDEGDNYALAFKHARDGFAAWVGVNDRSGARVRYVYAPQVMGERYGCRIWIRRRTT